MKRVLGLALALAGCAADPAEVTTDFTFEKVFAIAGEHDVVGVDSDDADGLWLAYQIPGGAYLFDDLRVVHLDAGGAKLAEHRFTEPDLPVHGLAYADGVLWLSHGYGVNDPKTRIRRLDAATGAELGELRGNEGIVDLDVTSGRLTIANMWCEVVAFDAATAAPLWGKSLIELPSGSAWSGGVARTGAGTWLLDADEPFGVLLDDTGATLATAAFPDEVAEWRGIDDLQLAYDGKRFIVNRNNQIVWYELRQP